VDHATIKDWVYLLLGVGGRTAIALAVAVWAFRPWQPAEVDAFARRAGILLDQAGGAVAGRYICRSRRWRLLGFLLPWTLLTVAQVLWTLLGDGPRPFWIPGATLDLAVAGYFVGAVLAEVTWRRVPTGTARTIAVSARVPEAYVPRWARGWQWGAPLVALALLGVVAFGLPGVPLWPAWPAAVYALAAAAIVEAALRWVLRLPQPFSTPSEIVLDDAIRARSMQILLGVGVAVEVLALAGLIMRVMDSTSSQAVGNGGSVALVVLLGTAVVLFMRLAAPHSWRVHRGVPVPHVPENRH
jgi:hypothetical protein